VTLWILLGLVVAPILISAAQLALKERPHWSTASHVSTGQAPDPALTPEPVVQVYAARTWGLRGSVAVHTWITSKRANADHYVRYEIIGWHLYRGNTALVRGPGRPDAMWFSNYPDLLVNLRGDGVESIIDKVESAVNAYPYASTYRTWPGPNSNTFTAFVGRQVPELGVDLPPTAVGKDYLANGQLIGPSPSGTGFQFSLWGLVGAMAAWKEGIELNLLGLVVGVDFQPLALKLPGLGRLGFK
jgi:hypothetical protein